MMSGPGSPRMRMRPIGPGAPMRMAGSPRATFSGGASVRSGRCPSRVWMTNMPQRRAAASTAAQGPTAALSRETSLPSAAPNPPGSRKSRCMSMMTSAVRPVSTSSGAGSAAMVRIGMATSLAGENNVLQERIDLVGPAVAAEHAVVPDAGLHMVSLEIGPQPRAQLVRGRGLADGADIVALAFDREQHGALDGARLDPLAAIFEPARRQNVLLEHEAHGLEIEFSGQVEHREILVVERLGHLRLLVFALRQIVVELAMRLEMALDVHAHESGKLHK